MATQRRICMLCLVALLIGVPAGLSSAGTIDDRMTLMLGAGSTVTLERPFDTILIDNPDIVDVKTLSDRSVVLEPLNLGVSNVLFIDERNIAIANIRVEVCDARTHRTYRAEPIYAGRPVPSFSKHAT